MLATADTVAASLESTSSEAPEDTRKRARKTLFCLVDEEEKFMLDFISVFTWRLIIELSYNILFYFSCTTNNDNQTFVIASTHTDKPLLDKSVDFPITAQQKILFLCTYAQSKLRVNVDWYFTSKKKNIKICAHT